MAPFLLSETDPLKGGNDPGFPSWRGVGKVCSRICNAARREGTVSGRIDYQIEKYSFTELGEPARLTRQWEKVIEKCRQSQAGVEERLRLALLHVDYVTSFELPFRLLLIRTPQLIASARAELPIKQKNAVFNDKRYGCVYSAKTPLEAIPEAFYYRLSNRIRRVDEAGNTAAPYQQIAKETRVPRERLRMALESGLQVTALDAMFWFGIQRLAIEVQRLRKTGIRIATFETEAFDNHTGTTRLIPAYRLASVGR